MRNEKIIHFEGMRLSAEEKSLLLKSLNDLNNGESTEALWDKDVDYKRLYSYLQKGISGLLKSLSEKYIDCAYVPLMYTETTEALEALLARTDQLLEEQILPNN